MQTTVNKTANEIKMKTNKEKQTKQQIRTQRLHAKLKQFYFIFALCLQPKLIKLCRNLCYCRWFNSIFTYFRLTNVKFHELMKCMICVATA